MAELPQLDSEWKARLRAELDRNRWLHNALDSGYLPSQDAFLKARLLEELRQKRTRRSSGLWRSACVAAIFLLCGWVGAKLKGSHTFENTISSIPALESPQGPVLHEKRTTDGLVIVSVSESQSLLEVLPTPSVTVLEASGALVVERPHLEVFHSVQIAHANAAFETYSNQRIGARAVERIMDWDLVKLPHVVALYGVPNGPKRLILSVGRQTRHDRALKFPSPQLDNP